MKKWSYYNEFDAGAAQWLRNLIAKGLIAPGEVDERSIEDVLPSDVRGFTQCHWFAGVGVWSAALRGAGFPDDRPAWTGSCPCQPFSQAGKGAGVDDKRHLWPAFFHLIQHGKPPGVPVFGEQVASKDGLAWLDLVQDDMEGAGYTFWPVDLSASGAGAPHIRQRLFFVAHPGHSERVGRDPVRATTGEHEPTPGTYEGSGEGGTLQAWEWPVDDAPVRGPVSGVADTKGPECELSGPARTGWPGPANGSDIHHERASTPNGIWGPADWLFCRDNKWRPVEPGTSPLAPRIADELGRSKSSLGAMARSNRKIRLKGYGNAINREIAMTFIEAVMPAL